jgi:hypothetical protein
MPVKEEILLGTSTSYVTHTRYIGYYCHRKYRR